MIRKRLTASAAALTLGAAMFLGGAAPAAAHYNFDHKPQSLICRVLGWCKSSYHYTCGDPRIAYTRPVPCSGHWYEH